MGINIERGINPNLNNERRMSVPELIAEAERQSERARQSDMEARQKISSVGSLFGRAVGRAVIDHAELAQEAHEEAYLAVKAAFDIQTDRLAEAHDVNGEACRLLRDAVVDADRRSRKSNRPMAPWATEAARFLGIPVGDGPF